MSVNILFLFLTFAVVIAIILYADSLRSAFVLVAALINLLFLVSRQGLLDHTNLVINVQAESPPVDLTEDLTAEPADSATDPVTTLVDGEEVYDEIDDTDRSGDMYGPMYGEWDSYRSGYNTSYDKPTIAVGASAAEKNYSIDEANALMVQRRTRDKKCSDGWLTKDADYYKYHFGNELNEAENKEWWTRHEY